MIFNYADNVNPQKYHDNGCKLEITKYLNNIQTKVDDTLVRQYDLAYETNTPANTRRYLSSVTERGNDGSSLPPTQFEYNSDEVNWDSQVQTNNIDDGPFTNDSNVVVNDVNADSFVDIVRSDPNGDYYVWFGNGNGWNTNKHKIVSTGNWILGASNGIIMTDMNSDGFSDLAKSTSAGLEVRLGIDGTSLDPTWYWWNYGYGMGQSMGDFNILDPKVSLTDVNADGYIDFFKFENGVGKVRPGTGFDGNGYRFEDTQTWSNNVPDLEDSSYAARVVDVTGDGLADIIKAYVASAGQYRYDVYYNEGDHWREDAATWISSTDWDLRAHKVQLVDVNADGLTDLLKGDGTNWSIRFNTGTSWTSQIYNKTGSYDMHLDDGNVSLADVNGDSLPDIIKSEGSTWKHHPHIAHAPKLLKTINTPYGGKTSIEYESSSQLDNTGSDNINDLRMNTWVVSKMTKDNGVSGDHGSITEEAYDYKHGKYNYVYGHDSRGFRGFGEVTVTSPTGNTNTTYFHQDDQRWGKTYKTEFKDDSGNLLTSSEQDWSASSTNGIYESLLQSQTDKLYNSVGESKTTKQDYQYDSYQNPTLVHNYADLDNADDDTYAYQEYVYNTSNNLVSGFAKHSYLLDSDNSSKLSENWTYYDNNISLDDAPSKGLVTKTEAWNDAGTNPTSQFEYDSVGNLTKTIDALNQESQIEYDTATNTFPVKQINPLLHETQTNYDVGTGNVLSITDANNIVTNFEYDSFGRKTAEILPYDNSQYPTRTFAYYYQDNKPYTVVTGQRLNSGTSDMVYTATISDGFDRELQTKISAPTAGSYIAIDTYYDDEGRAYKSSLPYYSNDLSYTSPDTSVASTTIGYDALSRPISTSYPDGASSNITYNLWQQTLTDANSHSTEHYLDANGQIIQITEHNNTEDYSTYYSYTGRAELEKITDHYNNTYDWDYSSLGQKLSYSDVASKVTSYSYDVLGRLTQETDPNNNLTQTEYDALSRITKIDYPSQDDVNYTYDTNKLGTLASKSYGDLSYGYAYDDRYRLASETRTFDTESATKTYSYNAMDLLSGSSVTDYFSKIYGFASNGEIINIKDDSSSDVISNIAYNQHGKITQLDFANGVSTAYNYDSLSTRLERILTSTASGSLFDTAYAYDAIGNVTSISDNKNNKTQNFIYDALDRLLRVNKAQATGTDTYAYSYDAIGNMTSATKDDDQTTTYNYGEGGYSSQQLTSLTVASSTLNQAPYFTSTPSKQINEGEIFSYGITALDPESEAVSLSILQAPEGASINGNTLTWSVPAVGASEQFFLLGATDASNNTSNQGFYLSIGDVNMTPVITSSPSLEVADNENYSYQVVASDGDLDDLTYSLLQSPSNMSIDSNSGLITWTHDAADHLPGEYQIEIQVSDGELSDTQSYTLTIYIGVLESFGSNQTYLGKANSDTEHFIIDNEHYLATINSWDQAANNTQLNSEIRKWDGNSFELFQNIPTNKAFDWEYSNIDGDHYLSVTNINDSNVDVYKWNGSQFAMHQSLSINSPQKQSTFTMNGDHYLGVACISSGGSSKLYKWINNEYQIFQTFPFESGAAFYGNDFEFFTIDGQHYLVQANHDGPWPTSTSIIYKWNGTEFADYQEFNDYSVFNFEFFEFDGREFLAFASYYDGDYLTNSRVLEWDGDSFETFQTFTETQGNNDWEYFKVGTEHYLAKINIAHSTQAYSNYSYIYKWNGSQFVEFDSFLSHSAMDAEHFTIDGVDYLSIAVGHNYAYTTDSMILKAVYDDRPAINSTPITQAQADQVYNYDVDAADSQTLSYSLAQAPIGMSIDASTGVITWIPGISDIATHTVEVQVTDGNYSVSQTYDLEVIANINDAPEITSTAITDAAAGEAYSYDVEFTDLDINDTHSFTLITAPAGMNIDASTGVITWIPSSGDIGDHSVEVEISDSSLTDTQSYTLTVAASEVLADFATYQTYLGKANTDTEQFVIDNEHYLAVTKAWDQSAGTTSLNSEIRKWDGDSFEVFQTIPTQHANDWDFTTIAGEHYLTVSNRDGNNAQVYKWNGSQFAFHQSLSVTKAYESRSFSIDNEHYMAVTSGWSEVDSKLFKWNNGQYQEHQTFSTGTDADFFTIDDSAYLAVAVPNISWPQGAVFIYKWNGSAFAMHQQRYGDSYMDVKFFEFDGREFLTEAIVYDGDYVTSSNILEWDGDSFEVFQTFTNTESTHDFEYFEVANDRYLAKINTASGTQAYNNYSYIYKWNGSQFVEFDSFLSHSAQDADHFVIDDIDYLSIAVGHNYVYTTNSIILKANYEGGAQQSMMAMLPLAESAMETEITALPDYSKEIADTSYHTLLHDNGSDYLLTISKNWWGGKRVSIFRLLEDGPKRIKSFRDKYAQAAAGLFIGDVQYLVINRGEKAEKIFTWKAENKLVRVRQSLDKLIAQQGEDFNMMDLLAPDSLDNLDDSEWVDAFMPEPEEKNILQKVWGGVTGAVENILPESLKSSSESESLVQPLSMSAMTAYIVPNNPFTANTSFTYDNNGNLLSDGKQAYAYNEANKMISVTDIATSNLVAEYIYDDAGQRAIEKIYTNGVLDKTVYKLFPDYEREIYADSSPSKETYYYYANNQLVARDERVSDANTRYYYHSDHLGSTSIITDSTGNLVEETEYRPYGGILSGGTESKHLYTGQEYDHSTGLNYYKSRYYQPHIQRFIQPDSIIPDAYDPQQLNPYVYARNNPIRYTDPSGHKIQDWLNKKKEQAGRWVGKRKEQVSKFAGAVWNIATAGGNNKQKYTDNSSRNENYVIEEFKFYDSVMSSTDDTGMKKSLATPLLAPGVGVSERRRSSLESANSNLGLSNAIHVGNHPMDTSAAGNIVYGFYATDVGLTVEEEDFQADKDQGANFGSPFQFKDNPDDKFQRRIGRKLHGETGGDVSQITVRMITEVADEMCAGNKCANSEWYK